MKPKCTASSSWPKRQHSELPALREKRRAVIIVDRKEEYIGKDS
ncbi:MAG: hypothetical protein QGE94_01615 [Desulfobacterales bacterium]|nr:hypothetical protein [Desulfobacterales bacterium]